MAFIRDVIVTKLETEVIEGFMKRVKVHGAIRERTRTLRIIKKYKESRGDIADQIYWEIISESVDDVTEPIKTKQKKK